MNDHDLNLLLEKYRKFLKEHNEEYGHLDCHKNCNERIDKVIKDIERVQQYKSNKTK